MICSSYQSQSKVHYILLHPKNPWNLLKPWLVRKVHAQLYTIFLFCSIITTQLLSTSLKSELQLWPVWELGIFHTLALNFKNWPFDVIITRHFRPKSVDLNEIVYFKNVIYWGFTQLSTTKHCWVMEMTGFGTKKT